MTSQTHFSTFAAKLYKKMKKFLPIAVVTLFAFGKVCAQNPLVLPTTVTAATQCTAPCNGTATVTNVSGGTPPYTYLWNPSGQQTQTATGLCPGQWQVGVWDASTPFPNQGTVMVTITCNTASGIADVVNSNNELIIFPNPASSELNLQTQNTNSGDANLTIRNMLGGVVYQEKMNSNGNINASIDISFLPSGVYSVEMACGSETIRNKFIKH